MRTSNALAKRKPGENLTHAARDVLIAKLVEALCDGYDSNRGLANKLGCDRTTIKSMRPFAESLIREMKFDRNYVRNKQVKVVYKLVEGLIEDLESCKTLKEKSLVHSAIAKHHQHLALILGLNTETHVNVGAQKLVIIRAEPTKGNNSKIIDGEQVTSTH